MSGIQIKTKTSEPIQSGGETRIRLVSQSITWIEKTWGLVWNRPVSVQVETDAGTQVIPIVDVTRIALVALWGLTAGMVLMMVGKPFKRRSNRDE
ncbi:MAG: hypothetical protein ACK2T7_03200 [Anaerolineales bacterium]